MSERKPVARAPEGRSTTIADAGPAASPTPAGMSGAEQRAFAAMRKLSSAADAVERHSGPRGGEEYNAKMLNWRNAYAEWRQEMRAYAKSLRTEGVTA